MLFGSLPVLRGLHPKEFCFLQGASDLTMPSNSCRVISMQVLRARCLQHLDWRAAGLRARSFQRAITPRDLIVQCGSQNTGSCLQGCFRDGLALFLPAILLVAFLLSTAAGRSPSDVHTHGNPG